MREVTAPSPLEPFADVAGRGSRLVQTGGITDTRTYGPVGRVVRATIP